MTQQQRPKPRSRQIADEIIERIRSGKIGPGEYIPSVRSLATKHSISTATALRVHDRIREEGLVRPVAGLGTIVCDPRLQTIG